MQSPIGASLAQLSAAIDDLYQRSDGLLSGLAEADWTRKHGKQWVMADVPYHLAYFDREIVLNPLKRGESVPEAERERFDTMAKIDAWNGREFAKRRPGMTPGEALEEMRSVRRDVREAMAGLNDAALAAGRVWIPLAGFGWQPARAALIACVAHNWSEHMQLRLRLKRRDFLPAPATTHLALDAFMHFFPMGMDSAAAAKKPMAARFDFDGPGGGAWTIRAGAAPEVVESAEGKADVTLRMTPDTFARMWNNMNNPMALMLTRRIRVKGLTHMGAFGKTFPTPRPDTPTHPELVTL